MAYNNAKDNRQAASIAKMMGKMKDPSSAPTTMLRGDERFGPIRKRKERKLEEERQRVAALIGDNPTYTVTGDVEGLQHNWSGYSPSGEKLPISTESERQKLIYDDENPRLTREDRLKIEKQIGSGETYEAYGRDGTEEGTITQQNPDFIGPANEMLKQKRKEAFEKLGRTESMYDMNLDNRPYYHKFGMTLAGRKYQGGDDVGKFTSGGSPTAIEWEVPND